MTTKTTIKGGILLGFSVAIGWSAWDGIFQIVRHAEPKLPPEVRELTPYDATDDAETGARSGLALHTDHGNGCQYLVTRQGHITPRLGSDGKQICE